MENNVKKIIEVLGLLRSENFQLSDIGLTPKTAFDWSRSGIHLRARKSKYRRTYNGIEYVWLRLVKELREFGLSLDAIKRVRDTFLTPFDLLDILQHSEDVSKKDLKLLKAQFENADHELLNTIIAQVLLSSMVLRNKAFLLITKNGDCRLTYERVTENLFDEPCINFPMDYLVSNFIARESLYGLESLNDSLGLSDQEMKVLQLIRDGQINSLTLKFKDNEINLIETEEEIDLKNVQGKLVDYINKGGYHEIKYKTQNGKIESMKRITKHK